MRRACAWLVIVFVGVLGSLLHNTYLTASIAPLALIVLWLFSPRSLRVPIMVIAACACAALIFAGAALMLEIMPALFIGLIGWIFARSLRAGGTPLIARAIEAIDGAALLDDPRIARYARQLTLIWAVFQIGLALLVTLCAMHTHASWFGAAPASSAAQTRCAVFSAVTPLLVLSLFIAEFTLRGRLLPQVPRHRLIPFMRHLVQVWPKLIDA